MMPQGQQNNNGVIYVAFGYKYLMMTAHSAVTVKQNNPGLKIAVLTNLKLNKDFLWQNKKLFDHVLYFDLENKANRLIKTNIYEHSPFDRSLFLDCDTEVVDDVSVGFKYLDRFDLAFRPHDYPVSYKNDYQINIGIPTKDFSHWNSGVFFFKKNEKTQAFFKTWHEAHKKFGYSMDQPSLVYAIYNNDVRVLPLNLTWNIGQPLLKTADKRIAENLRILHYRPSRKIDRKVFALAKKVHDGLLETPDAYRADLLALRRKVSWLYGNPILRRLYAKYARIRSSLGK